MEFKEGDNRPYASCSVVGCKEWFTNPEDVKDHLTKVHGVVEEEAEEIATEFRDFIVKTAEKWENAGKITPEEAQEPAGKEAMPYFDGKKFIPKRLADDIMADLHFATIDDTREIYVYDGKVYRPHGENKIREEVEKRLGEKTRTHYKNEVIEYIRDATYVSREEFNNPPELLAVENGILNVKTKELRDHTPEELITIKLPVKYDPKAECPKIENFLSEILKEDNIPIIQEFVGFCLLKEYRFHRALMLTGGGANGKSTFLNLVRRLLGISNVSSPSLHDLLYNRFAKADLYGKLANIHADIPDRALKNTGAFKMLTGQDQIYAEKKHKDAFHFDNYAKLLFSANEIPETKDKTRAFFRRWIVIEFPYKFTDDPEDENKDKDPNILEKITTKEELSGFLNWALEGLERLLENNQFSTTLTPEERADIWEEMSDPIVAFKEAKLEVRPEVYGTKDEIYLAYVKFCHDRSTPPLDKNVFARELPKRVPVEEYYPKIDGRQTKSWKGITLKENMRDMRDVSINKGQNEKVNSSKGVSLETYVNENTPHNLNITNRDKEILRHLKRYGGATPEDLADELDMMFSTVKESLEKLFDTDLAEKSGEKIGGGRVYKLVKE